jgi:hypothetical protein
MLSRFASLGGINDPYWANVSYMLVGNGANGTNTNIKDSSSNNFTTNNFGSTVISTAQSKYGSGSVYFNGAGNYLTVPASSKFNLGTSNFTIEMWVNTPGTYSNFRVSPIGQTDPINGRWAVRPRGLDGTFGIVFSPDGSAYYDVGSGLTLPANTWVYVVVERVSGVFKFYVNGTKGTDFTAVPSMAIGSGSSPLYIGRAVWDGNIDWPGYIYDLRFTLGVARYSGSTMTVPTEPLPIG